MFSFNGFQKNQVSWSCPSQSIKLLYIFSLINFYSTIFSFRLTGICARIQAKSRQRRNQDPVLITKVVSVLFFHVSISLSLSLSFSLSLYLSLTYFFFLYFLLSLSLSVFFYQPNLLSFISQFNFRVCQVQILIF